MALSSRRPAPPLLRKMGSGCRRRLSASSVKSKPRTLSSGGRLPPPRRSRLILLSGGTRAASLRSAPVSSVLAAMTGRRPGPKVLGSGTNHSQTVRKLALTKFLSGPAGRCFVVRENRMKDRRAAAGRAQLVERSAEAAEIRDNSREVISAAGSDPKCSLCSPVPW